MIWDKILEQPEPSRRQKKNFYVTDANRCDSQLWAQINGLPASDPIKKISLLKMRTGDLIEDLYAAELKSGFRAEQQKYFTQLGALAHISGKADFVISLGGDKVGIELKSTFGYGITSMRNAGLPKDDYIVQARQYMKAFGIRRWMIHVIDRASFYVLEFELQDRGRNGLWCIFQGQEQQIQDINMMELKRKYYRIKTAKTPPPRPYFLAIKDGKEVTQVNNKKSDWQCLYCQYKSACWRLK